MSDNFGTPKNNKHILIYNALHGCPGKVRKTGKYNVTIIFREEEIKKFRFTGVLLDETLEQVLNVIKLTAPISYSLDGKTVYLSSDKNSIIDFSKYIK